MKESADESKHNKKWQMVRVPHKWYQAAARHQYHLLEGRKKIMTSSATINDHSNVQFFWIKKTINTIN